MKRSGLYSSTCHSGMSTHRLPSDSQRLGNTPETTSTDGGLGCAMAGSASAGGGAADAASPNTTSPIAKRIINSAAHRAAAEAPRPLAAPPRGIASMTASRHASLDNDRAPQ